MTYYRGSGEGYPHPLPERAGWRLFYIRNAPGWRVAVPEADAFRLRPFDLYRDNAKQIWCKNVLGKQFPIQSLVGTYELFRHVEVVP